MRKNHELVDITVILKHETEKAWLLNDGSKDIWVPKSKGELAPKGPVWELTIPQGLAEEKGFV